MEHTFDRPELAHAGGWAKPESGHKEEYLNWPSQQDGVWEFALNKKATHPVPESSHKNEEDPHLLPWHERLWDGSNFDSFPNTEATKSLSGAKFNEEDQYLPLSEKHLKHSWREQRRFRSLMPNDDEPWDHLYAEHNDPQYNNPIISRRNAIVELPPWVAGLSIKKPPSSMYSLSPSRATKDELHIEPSQKAGLETLPPPSEQHSWMQPIQLCNEESKPEKVAILQPFDLLDLKKHARRLCPFSGCERNYTYKKAFIRHLKMEHRTRYSDFLNCSFCSTRPISSTWGEHVWECHMKLPLGDEPVSLASSKPAATFLESRTRQKLSSNEASSYTFELVSLAEPRDSIPTQGSKNIESSPQNPSEATSVLQDRSRSLGKSAKNHTLDQRPMVEVIAATPESCSTSQSACIDRSPSPTPFSQSNPSPSPDEDKIGTLILGLQQSLENQRQVLVNELSSNETGLSDDTETPSSPQDGSNTDEPTKNATGSTDISPGGANKRLRPANNNRDNDDEDNEGPPEKRQDRGRGSSASEIASKSSNQQMRCLLFESERCCGTNPTISELLRDMGVTHHIIICRKCLARVEYNETENCEKTLKTHQKSCGGESKTPKRGDVENKRNQWESFHNLVYPGQTPPHDIFVDGEGFLHDETEIKRKSKSQRPKEAKLQELDQNIKMCRQLQAKVEEKEQRVRDLEGALKDAEQQKKEFKRNCDDRDDIISRLLDRSGSCRVTLPAALIDRLKVVCSDIMEKRDNNPLLYAPIWLEIPTPQDTTNSDLDSFMNPPASANTTGDMQQ